jgi:hypothetical protein
VFAPSVEPFFDSIDPRRTRRLFGFRTRGRAVRPAGLPGNDAATSRTQARKRSTTGLKVADVRPAPETSFLTVKRVISA